MRTRIAEGVGGWQLIADVHLAVRLDVQRHPQDLLRRLFFGAKLRFRDVRSGVRDEHPET